MSDYNPKEYRREKFNKKKKDKKTFSREDFNDNEKRNKAFKKHKKQIEEEYDWEEDYNELR